MFVLDTAAMTWDPVKANTRTGKISRKFIREAELARSAKRLAELTPEQREAVEALTRSLTAKLLHPQLTALRESTRLKSED